jgi:hypothetical protein
VDIKWFIENLEVVKCMLDREKTSIVGIIAPTSGSGSFSLAFAPIYSPPSVDLESASNTTSKINSNYEYLPPELVIAMEPLNLTFSYHDLRLALAIANQLSAVDLVLSSSSTSTSTSADFPWPIVCIYPIFVPN